MQREYLKKIAFLLAFSVVISASACGESIQDESVSSDIQSETSSSSLAEDLRFDGLEIHFLELGNKYTGDCTLIDVGDVEVLIDAGSRKGSAATLVPYVNEYCADGVLEYVIATHAHQDHIAGFVGTADTDGILESFVCQTIIDYPRSDSTSKIRSEYEALRDQEVKNGAKHYTALECYRQENGAKNSYTLGAGITLTILYQEYYENKASDENEYSVCVLLTQGERNFLFTGDLEEKGEASLVKHNDLPQCVLYKAGHHGSISSSTDTLLSVIQPEIVCVCCCCGNMEYAKDPLNDFPSQTFVDNIAPYTDKVYVTTIVSDNEKGFTSMNGNIKVKSDNAGVSVHGSNNDTLFKDTDWFEKNRTMPSNWKSK